MNKRGWLAEWTKALCNIALAMVPGSNPGEDESILLFLMNISIVKG